MEGFYFDKKAADLAVAFFEKLLVHSKGEWAGQPFRLQDWQREDIIRPLFGWKRADGTRKYRTAYIEIPRKNGKMLCMNTLLPTPSGWTTMGEIQAGDYVFAPDGSPCRVTAVSAVDPAPVSYRIKFSNGEEVVACADHEWVTTARVDTVGAHETKTRRKIMRWKPPSIQVNRGSVVVQTYGKQIYVGREGAPGVAEKAAALVAADLAANPVGVNYLTRVRTTQEIYETQTYGKRGDRNHSLRMPDPIQMSDANLPIDPYVLGAWLGNGSTANALITCGGNDVSEMVSLLESRGARVHVKYYPSSRTAATLRTEGLQVALRQLGLLGNKHIPAQYLRASFAQRLALLQGLMDTDGTVDAKGMIFELVTTLESLAAGVGELLATMGIKYVCTQCDATLKGRVVGTKWRIQFNAYSDTVPVFRMGRKLARMRQQPATNTRSKSVQIVSVEPCDPVPMRCIEVDHPSHEYLFGRTMLPTHNSTLCAGLGLYLLFADGEPGAEVYSAAADTDQARIVFEEAQRMVEASPALSEHGQIYRRSILVKSERSTYRVISADAHTKHGFNAHGVIFDELHAQPNRDLWDVLNTSTGARRQPLMIMITTAGVYDPNSICWEQHEYARQVLAGVIDDPSYFAYIAAADEADDWTSPVVWAKANPGLGETIKLDYLEAECRRAIASPAYQNTFRRLHLNQWTAQEERWLDMGAWNACQRELPDLRGRTCYGGLDLASTTDIAAFVLVFPPVEDDEPYWILPHFWIPQDGLIERVRRDRVPYDAWRRDGLVTATPGAVIDYYYIEQTIRQLALEYDIQEIAFDRWGATLLYQRMEEARQTMIQFGQGYQSMSPPSKEFMSLILARRLAHNGNPVLRWMADNVIVRIDPAGNVKPDKARSRNKIDGIVAAIMGLDRALRHAPSAYEERGVLEL